ncbi:core histone macro-H2A.1 [Platysternon megacephalum]|uniref:Core histone macro-H2A.1 n=1 Tax=Platysternon megacephalum TaxID=55544 RepID=A0A4D9EPS6_9SAUR|nr:core histone macro-H2A.1 [Platysternon megacephalum]
MFFKIAMSVMLLLQKLPTLVKNISHLRVRKILLHNVLSVPTNCLQVSQSTWARGHDDINGICYHFTLQITVRKLSRHVAFVWPLRSNNRAVCIFKSCIGPQQ